MRDATGISGGSVRGDARHALNAIELESWRPQTEVRMVRSILLLGSSTGVYTEAARTLG